MFPISKKVNGSWWKTHTDGDDDGDDGYDYAPAARTEGDGDDDDGDYDYAPAASMESVDKMMVVMTSKASPN